jgi:hypothetical protein
LGKVGRRTGCESSVFWEVAIIFLQKRINDS